MRKNDECGGNVNKKYLRSKTFLIDYCTNFKKYAFRLDTIIQQHKSFIRCDRDQKPTRCNYFGQSEERIFSEH